MKVNPPAAERKGHSYLLVDTPAPPPDHPGGPDPTVRIRKILPSGQTTQQLHMTGQEFRDAATVVGYVSAAEAKRMSDEAPRKRAEKIVKAELARAMKGAAENKAKPAVVKEPRSNSATRGWETRRAKAKLAVGESDPDPAKESAPDPDPTFTGTEGEPSP